MSIILWVALVAIALALAYFLDRNLWSRKSTQALQSMILANDWKKWSGAIAELKRRGYGVEEFLPHLVNSLVDESRWKREAARAMLTDNFPELKSELGTFRSIDPPSAMNQVTQGLLRRFPMPSGKA